MVFQKCVHTVKRSPRSAAEDGDDVVTDDDSQVLRAEVFNRGAGNAGPNRRPGPDADVAIGSRRHVHDRQPHARRFGKEVLKLLGRISLAGDRMLIDHDVPALHRSQVHAA